MGEVLPAGDGDNGSQVSDDSSLQVSNQEEVLRLAWWPGDIDAEGFLVPSAFSKQDLTKRGVSVDRRHLAERKVIVALANLQQRKDAEKRQQSYVAPASVEHIRAIKDSYGCATFEVHASPQLANPSLPENRAHAHILTQVKLSQSMLNAARLELVGAFGKPVSLEEIFGLPTSNDTSE